MKIDLNAKPFHLTKKQSEQVYDIFEGMTQEEKIGQR